VRDWAEYDAVVRASAINRIPLVMVIVNCPDWACTTDSGPLSDETLAAQSDFVHEAVRRYGTGGGFWTENPDLAPLPVTEWQVWNEPNAAAFWPPAPDAAAYARLLRTDAAAIRSADPGATVVLAGLTEARACAAPARSSRSARWTAPETWTPPPPSRG
jgi:hypothetical protein